MWLWVLRRTNKKCRVWKNYKVLLFFFPPFARGFVYCRNEELEAGWVAFGNSKLLHRPVSFDNKPHSLFQVVDQHTLQVKGTASVCTAELVQGNMKLWQSLLTLISVVLKLLLPALWSCLCEPQSKKLHCRKLGKLVSYYRSYSFLLCMWTRAPTSTDIWSITSW